MNIIKNYFNLKLRLLILICSVLVLNLNCSTAGQDTANKTVDQDKAKKEKFEKECNEILEKLESDGKLLNVQEIESKLTSEQRKYIFKKLIDNNKSLSKFIQPGLDSALVSSDLKTVSKQELSFEDSGIVQKIRLQSDNPEAAEYGKMGAVVFLQNLNSFLIAVGKKLFLIGKSENSKSENEFVEKKFENSTFNDDRFGNITHMSASDSGLYIFIVLGKRAPFICPISDLTKITTHELLFRRNFDSTEDRIVFNALFCNNDMNALTGELINNLGEIGKLGKYNITLWDLKNIKNPQIIASIDSCFQRVTDPAKYLRAPYYSHNEVIIKDTIYDKLGALNISNFNIRRFISSFYQAKYGSYQELSDNKKYVCETLVGTVARESLIKFCPEDRFILICDVRYDRTYLFDLSSVWLIDQLNSISKILLLKQISEFESYDNQFLNNKNYMAILNSFSNLQRGYIVNYLKKLVARNKICLSTILPTELARLIISYVGGDISGGLKCG